MKSKKDLWKSLKEYRFANLAPISLADRIKGAFGSTDAFTLAFAAKVAKKNGWTNEFAFLAVREYKKFVFLGVTSHYEVTPSAIIDKVWHEHQLFTKGYREFCQNVLGRHFDHSPELVPFDAQIEVFNAQYQKTLAFYAHEFGMTAPEEIWGRPKFNPATVKGSIPKPERKKADSSRSVSDADTPVHTMFSSGPDSNFAPIPVTFAGNGGMNSGAGATGSWDAPQAGHSTHSSGDHSSTSSSSSATSCSSSSSCGGGGSSCGGSS